MNYISTRGYHDEQKFSEILLSGLAPDGGLYLPIEYPKITHSELDQWRTISYASLTFEILKKFITDIPRDDLEKLIHKTYSAEIYQHVRQGEDPHDITPIRVLEENGDNKLILQSLSNGPTLAFKDMAMQLLGNLFEYTLSKNNSTLNILGATSGDTGSAAEYAMRGKKGICVFMLSPHEKMSSFQAAQMFSIKDSNIFNIAIKGMFDDCQDIVKEVSNDHVFKHSQKIGTVNSINWARIVAQVVYYFRGYLNATAKNTQKVSFTVPSGNFGNICAGHIARMMGLPIDKLVVATNENNVLDEFFRTGTYKVRSSSNTYHTSSPSMDISKASNFERFIYDLLERDYDRVTHLFSKLEKTGSFCLSGRKGSDGDEFKKVSAFGFKSGQSNHQERLNTIRQTKDSHGIIVDTHTADGIKVAREHISPGTPMIVLETALPVKFNETIYEALGYYAEPPINLKNIESLPQYFEVMAASVSNVKKFITSQGSK